MTISFVPDSPYQALLQSPGGVANVRITLQSGVPIMTSSVLAATTFFVTPYLGGRIPIFNPVDQVWRYELFSETAFQLSLGTGAQQVTTASNYDVYAYLTSTNAGARPLIALSPAWASDTSLGTNPGSAERFAQGGLLLNRWNIPGGPPPMRGTLLGTIRTGSSAAVDFVFGGLSTTTVYSTATFNVSNYFNQRELTTFLANTTNSWTVLQSATGASTQPLNNQTTARIQFVRCVDEEPVKAQLKMFVQTVPNTGIYAVGFGLDQTTSFAPAGSNIGVAVPVAPNVTSVNWSISGDYNGLPGAGFHFLSPSERAFAGTTTVNGWSAVNPTGITFTGKF